MLTGTGLGWSLLPRSMVSEELCLLETDAPPLHRTLGCATNPGRTRSNAAVAFIRTLAEFADPAPATAPRRDQHWGQSKVPE